MRYKIIIITILITCSMVGYSQKKSTYPVVENLTYKYYQQENWDSLLVVGIEALDQGMDYYYLRMRVGIAYYEKKKYTKAIEHFRKALSFYKLDNVASEYLYYCYIFLGMEYEAKTLTETFDEKRKDSMNIRNSFLKDVSVSGGKTMNNDFKQLSGNPINENHSIYNENNLAKDNLYGGISLSHFLGKSIKVTHSYTYLQYNRIDNYYDDFSGISQFPHTSQQNQYFISAGFRLKRDRVFTVGYHQVWLHSYSNTISYSREVAEVPLFKNNLIDTREHSFVLGLSKSKNNSVLDVHLIFSNFSQLSQRQLSLGNTLYPLSNRNLYFRTEAMASFQKGGLSPNGPNWAVEETIGGKIGKIWLEAGGKIGSIANMTNGNGSIIYNDPDLKKSEIHLGVTIPTSIGLNLSLTGQLENKESKSIIYTDEINFYMESFQYMNGGVFLTLTYRFK